MQCLVGWGELQPYHILSCVCATQSLSHTWLFSQIQLYSIYINFHTPISHIARHRHMVYCLREEKSWGRESLKREKQFATMWAAPWKWKRFYKLMWICGYSYSPLVLQPNCGGGECNELNATATPRRKLTDLVRQESPLEIYKGSGNCWRSSPSSLGSRASLTLESLTGIFYDPSVCGGHYSP